jgi:hypothetical protein
MDVYLDWGQAPIPTSLPPPVCFAAEEPSSFPIDPLAPADPSGSELPLLSGWSKAHLSSDTSMGILLAEPSYVEQRSNKHLMINLEKMANLKRCHKPDPSLRNNYMQSGKSVTTNYSIKKKCDHELRNTRCSHLPQGLKSTSQPYEKSHALRVDNDVLYLLVQFDNVSAIRHGSDQGIIFFF